MFVLRRPLAAGSATMSLASPAMLFFCSIPTACAVG